MGRALLHAYPLWGGTFIATPQQLEAHGSMLSLEWAKLRPAQISDVSWDMCAFEVKGGKHRDSGISLPSRFPVGKSFS